MNKRRKIILALGASALASPLTAYAQTKTWRIGFLLEIKQSYYDARIEAFKAGMLALGYAEGRNYVIEYRSAENDLARFPALVAELLALKVDVIVAPSTPPAVAARNSDVPVLIVTVGDPVGSGLAATLRRPGGNVTGLTGLNTELYTKRLDLLRQILPGMRRAGFLYSDDNASSIPGLKRFESDCAKLKITSLRAIARKAEEIPAAFNFLQREKAQGLIVVPNGTNTAARASIIELAAKHRLPAVYSIDIFAEAGGLISYAPNELDMFRRTAAYADKIFKGAKPADLPIEQPAIFEMVLNLKTAKALGIKIPGSVLVQATKVMK